MADYYRNRRLARAIKRAAEILAGSNYCVTLVQGGLFNLEATREREIRKIRVVIDSISRDDELKVRSLKLPGVCIKEIWCKKWNQSLFLIKEIE